MFDPYGSPFAWTMQIFDTVSAQVKRGLSGAQWRTFDLKKKKPYSADAGKNLYGLV